MRTLPMAHGTIRTCSATVISPLAIALQEKADGIDRQARVFPIKKTVDLARQRRYHGCRAGPKALTDSHVQFTDDFQVSDLYNQIAKKNIAEEMKLAH